MPSFEGKYSPEELAAANSVARYVDLEAVTMIDGAFALLEQQEPVPPLAGAAVMVDSIYEYDSEQNTLSVRVKFSLNCKPSTTAHAESVFTARTTFLLSYRLVVEPPPPEMRESLFRGFARVNGAFNAWPYLREFVQTSAARAGLLSMTLPVFRVPSPARVAPEQSSDAPSVAPTSRRSGGQKSATSRKKPAKN